MSLEAIKLKNEQLIRSWGLVVNESLPLIEDASEVEPQSASAVAARACAMGYVAALGFDTPSRFLMERLDEFGLRSSLTPRELALFDGGPLAEQQKIDCTWLIEGVNALAWCLGLVEMDHRSKCDDSLASRMLFGKDPSTLIESAQLRRVSEIQSECDLLYRLHWYARNCRFVGMPSRISESIVRERRHAVDWAYGVESDWDKVPGDT